MSSSFALVSCTLSPSTVLFLLLLTLLLLFIGSYRVSTVPGRTPQCSSIQVVLHPSFVHFLSVLSIKHWKSSVDVVILLAVLEFVPTIFAQFICEDFHSSAVSNIQTRFLSQCEETFLKFEHDNWVNLIC